MKELKPAIVMFIAFTIICGIIYPLVVTGIAQAVFPTRSNGSFIKDKSGKIVGSSLLGQPFSAAKYFWSRPSATTDYGYNPMASSGSNSGPSNPDYLTKVAARVRALRDAGVTGPVPADLVQASASGLDPHISVDAANVQIPRVAKVRGISPQAVRELVDTHTDRRQLGFLGDPRVNVLELNLALDAMK